MKFNADITNKKFNCGILIFTKQNKEKTIEVIVDEESVWLSQKLMAELFGTTRNNITMHIVNVLENELSENSVCKEFLHTAGDGKNIKLNTII